MLSLGTEKLKISYCMIKILILGWRNYCIWKLYRIRCFLLRFSGMSTSERKMFSNKIQASPTYSILTRKRKDFTDCWNSVSIKQVRLTQFWQEFSKKLQDKVLAGFNQASSTYSILTYLRRRYNEIMGYVSIKQVQLTQFWHVDCPETCVTRIMFQSSKSNLLNSDVSYLWWGFPFE